MSKYETDFISHFFSKVPNLGLCGENGFFYKYPKENKYNEIIEIQDWSWRDTVLKILKEFTEKTEGSYYIEKKPPWVESCSKFKILYNRNNYECTCNKWKS